MTKPNFALILFAALAFLMGLSVPRVEAQDSADLTADVAALEARISELEASNEAVLERLDQTTRYLQKQAAVTKNASLSLDESESLGFTRGINFRSREVLLSAFRTVWTAQQDGIPRAQPKRGSRKTPQER